MRKKHRLLAVALGMLLCSVVPAATYAQDKEVARGNAASRAGIDVELLTLPPLGRADTGLAGLVERSDRTEILVTLTEVPPDLVGPNLIAEIHEGSCRDLKSGRVRATEEAVAVYSLTPSVFSLRSFGAVLPVSLAALRRSAHAITVRTGPEAGNAALTCVDVA